MLLRAQITTRGSCSDIKQPSLPTLRLLVQVTKGAKVGAPRGGVKRAQITVLDFFFSQILSNLQNSTREKEGQKEIENWLFCI